MRKENLRKENLQKEYFTILNTSEAELEEKKSRFIASVKPVPAEETAQEFIAAVKSRFRDASHNVYAWNIYGKTFQQKFSDDGEPQGTAGLPVLEAIKKAGVQDVVVVVTRYFGGTLLGASGLARAYGKCAHLGLEAGKIIKKIRCIEVTIIAEYALYGKINSYIIKSGYQIKETKYIQDAEITVYIPVENTGSFMSEIDELTNARAITIKGNPVYITQT